MNLPRLHLKNDATAESGFAIVREDGRVVIAQPKPAVVTTGNFYDYMKHPTADMLAHYDERDRAGMAGD